MIHPDPLLFEYAIKWEDGTYTKVGGFRSALDAWINADLYSDILPSEPERLVRRRMDVSEPWAEFVVSPSDLIYVLAAN